MACKEDHLDTDPKVVNIPIDQGGVGRHLCAACAYDQGVSDGRAGDENIDIRAKIESLEESQKGDHRHRSPVVSYMFGYINGVRERNELPEFSW